VIANVRKPFSAYPMPAAQCTEMIYYVSGRVLLSDLIPLCIHPKF
jgi:hypothetical protein